jgi:hypothetical protein
MDLISIPFRIANNIFNYELADKTKLGHALVKAIDQVELVINVKYHYLTIYAMPI